MYYETQWNYETDKHPLLIAYQPSFCYGRTSFGYDWVVLVYLLSYIGWLWYWYRLQYFAYLYCRSFSCSYAWAVCFA